jgi:hypothetical protein
MLSCLWSGSDAQMHARKKVVCVLLSVCPTNCCEVCTRHAIRPLEAIQMQAIRQGMLVLCARESVGHTMCAQAASNQPMMLVRSLECPYMQAGREVCTECRADHVVLLLLASSL